MSIDELLDIARNGHTEIPKNWMPATAVRSIIREDPAVIWLDHFGEAYGFRPEKSQYDFLSFIAAKARQFEDKWFSEMAPDAVVVCVKDYEVRSVGKVLETLGHMRVGVPVIVKPALWWGPERIYGVPDAVISTDWLKQKFPNLGTSCEKPAMASNASSQPLGTEYVVFDIKFTTGLEGSSKKLDLLNYGTQVRIYSYILGHLQGIMPQRGYLVARDHPFEPLPVEIRSVLGRSLDADIVDLREHFVEITKRGENYRPWIDPIVDSNLSNDDEKWKTAKELIARERFPGRDPALLYQVSPSVRQALRELGFSSLDSLSALEGAAIPFEKCKGLGNKKSKMMRAIVEANRSGRSIRPHSSSIPPAKRHELFVDFEYLTNVNVDFDTQWPAMEGREMVFMIGVGHVKNDRWLFRSFVARAEEVEAEREMFADFVCYLDEETDGKTIDAFETVLYHWTSAEVWQADRCSDRLGLDRSHCLRALPWCDLQKPFLEVPAGIPGAWGYGLKEIAKAIGRLHPEIGVHWPEGLDEGLRAMVMGWHAYRTSDPSKSYEMAVLNTYLQVDCLALLSVIKWLRTPN